MKTCGNNDDNYLK